ncbi:hypothetical protein [Variovorax sp. KK3]|uniref:hypothetical protein n=1 Tax=Variovorax sp. KK3 TaxID=1855728 RepID=UPI00097C94F9|nr:hypothetical protein [Variovorax sp. KK3]
MTNSKLTNGAALLITLAFLLASGWLLYAFGLTGDKAWDRAVVVYNALTSVGFAAVGVLLGTKVQQVNVEKANGEADKAKADAARKADAIKTALTEMGKPPAAAVDEAGGGIAPLTHAQIILRQALQ